MALDRERIIGLLKQFTYLQNAVVYEITTSGQMGPDDTAIFYSLADNYDPLRTEAFVKGWREAVEHHVKTRTDGVGFREDPGPDFKNTGSFVMTREVMDRLGWAVAGYIYTEQQDPTAKKFETLYRLELLRYHLVMSKLRAAADPPDAAAGRG